MFLKRWQIYIAQVREFMAKGRQSATVVEWYLPRTTEPSA